MNPLLFLTGRIEYGYRFVCRTCDLHSWRTGSR